MKFLIPTLLFIIGFTVSLVALAKPETDGWRAYRTENFVMYSKKSPESVEKILYEFEIFRAAVYQALQLNLNKHVIPVEIYIMDDPADYSYFRPNNASGYFQDTIFGPKMVVGPQELNGLSRQSILYHEYLHYLLRSTSAFKYPHWYNEGLAEYYSTLEIKDDHIVIGKATIRRSLNRGSVRRIDNVMGHDKSKQVSPYTLSEYYASSWLLVHFFSLSAVNDFPDYRGSLSNYLVAFNNGADHDSAFASSFDIDMSELKKQLKKYLRKNHFNLARLPLPKAKPTNSIELVSKAEISREFAYLADPSSEIGEALLDQAIELEDANAIAYRAFQLASVKTSESKRWLDKAQSLENIEADGLVNIARAYALIAAKSKDHKQALLRQSKQYFEKALAIAVLPQIHYLYPDVLWQLGYQQEAIDHVVLSIKTMPANIMVNMQAGKYMLKIKNYPYARRFLNNVVNWSENPIYAGQALLLLSKIPAS